MSRKRKPLNVISDLSADEQTEIYHLMLHSHKSYEEISDLLFERHRKRVSKNTVARYFHRCCEDEDIENLPEIKESAGAWLHYKETGETGRFDEAALERLKLRTFQLSETLKDQKELTQLKSLFGILFAARLAEVRERTVAVRERLATVRENHATQAAPRSTRATPTSDRSHPTDPSHPTRTPNLENIEEPENPTARVVKACGGVPEFFGMIRPGERVTHAIRRMWYEIEAGTFVPPPPTPETITPPGVPVGPNGEIKPEHQQAA